MAVPLTIDETLPNIKGKLISFDGDLSTKRNQIIKQFILDGFQEEGVSCVVTLTISANELIDELSNYSPEASMIVNEAILNERLQIVDMYSFRGIEHSDEIPGTHMLPSVDDLTLLSITLNKISKAYPKSRYTVWPYSLLSIYTNHADLLNFTQTLAARLSARNQTGLLVTDKGVIPDDRRASIESIVDSVISTKKEEVDEGSREFFRVKFFRGADEMDYESWTEIS